MLLQEIFLKSTLSWVSELIIQGEGGSGPPASHTVCYLPIPTLVCLAPIPCKEGDSKHILVM